MGCGGGDSTEGAHAGIEIVIVPHAPDARYDARVTRHCLPLHMLRRGCIGWVGWVGRLPLLLRQLRERRRLCRRLLLLLLLRLPRRCCSSGGGGGRCWRREPRQRAALGVVIQCAAGRGGARGRIVLPRHRVLASLCRRGRRRGQRGGDGTGVSSPD